MGKIRIDGPGKTRGMQEKRILWEELQNPNNRKKS